MPITDNAKIIQKYVPEKHIVGASVEVDNSGYLLLRDNFISIFPSIMEYKEKDPFGSEDIVVKFRWCAHLVYAGTEMLIISNTLKSLKEEVEGGNFNLWNTIPVWYTTILEKAEHKIVANIWEVFFKKDIILYLKLQQEYGFMQGEEKIDKPLLFPKKQINKHLFSEKLSIILKDKVMKGEITKEKYNNIINEYTKN